MRDVGREIGAAFAGILRDQELDEAQERFRCALARVKLDPPADDPAWDEYEAASAALAELRSAEEA